jgi:hypothetical protein
MDSDLQISETTITNNGHCNTIPLSDELCCGLKLKKGDLLQSVVDTENGIIIFKKIGENNEE